MKGIKINEYIKFIKPEYLYLRLTPKTSTRNNSTHNFAKAIASIYKNILRQIKVDQHKLIKVLGKEFLVGTKYSIEQRSIVSYFIYIEHRKVEFYLIIPKQYATLLKEKVYEVWDGINVDKVNNLPEFGKNATKYQMVYSKEDGLSLKVDERSNMLLENNLKILDVLEEGDKVGIQYNFRPISQHSWQSEFKEVSNKIRKGVPVNRNKVGVSFLVRQGFKLLSDLLNEIVGLFGNTNKVYINKNTDMNLQMIEMAFANLTNTRLLQPSTYRKGNDTVVGTQIIVSSESKERLRQVENAVSLSQTFDCISDDNSLVRKSIKKKDYLKVGTNECTNFLALPGREILERYPFIEHGKTQEQAVPEELSQGTMCIGECKVPGKSEYEKAYLSDDFDYRMLSLILIGPNRAGKSKLMANLAKDALNNGECVIIPDFISTCGLSSEIASVFPKERVLEITCNDFKTIQGLGYNEVPRSTNPFEQYKNAKEQTALLTKMVDSINADDANFTARMGRYFESAALTVFLSNGPIKDVFAVLMNHKLRDEYIKKVSESQLENMSEYIDYLRELDEVSDKKADKGKVVGTRMHLVSGAIDRLQRLKVNAYIELMLKKGSEGNVNLVEEFQKSQLIVIKMPQRMFLTDNEKDVYVTYWLTKIWLALQIRDEKFNSDRAKMLKVNLLIDELYQVNNAEKFLKEKLSQLPKFNIKPIISCHYLNQLKYIREEFRSANPSFMLIAGCDKNNFKELSSELYPFEESDLLNLERFQSLNLIKTGENNYGKFITWLPKPIS